MQYLTDENKNITHVLVPINDWNTMLQSRNEDQVLNPYQPVLDWLDHQIQERSVTGDIPRLVGATEIGKKEALYSTLPSYIMLKEILQKETLSFGDDFLEKMFGKLGVILSEMYSFALVANTVDIAVAYILRNNEFYMALSNTEGEISASDKQVLHDFGFNIQLFKEKADPKLLGILYRKNKSEFAFSAMSYNIVDFFHLLPAKKRMRREPEILRLFFFDIFEALDEILKKEASFIKIFEKYPLVDVLAQAIYPDNTLSGATSRVYKATKEANTIISSGVKSYVFILTPKTTT